MLLALKVEVHSVRGAQEGVPRLLELMERSGAQATFFLSLGPDRGGWLSRLSPPEIGRRCAEVLRRVEAAGHEAGVSAWDAGRWRERVEDADPAWTEDEMRRAVARFQELFGHGPKAHAAPGWQTNRQALRLTQRLGFDYASDCRGSHPFVPVHRGEIIACPQLPTTLPTLEELMAGEGIAAEALPERLLALTAAAPQTGHVFSLRAEREGMDFAPPFERLLAGWRDQGYTLAGTGALFATLDAKHLPREEVDRGSVPGRSATLMVQGAPFLAEYETA